MGHGKRHKRDESSSESESESESEKSKSSSDSEGNAECKKSDDESSSSDSDGSKSKSDSGSDSESEEEGKSRKHKSSGEANASEPSQFDMPIIGKKARAERAAKNAEEDVELRKLNAEYKRKVAAFHKAKSGPKSGKGGLFGRRKSAGNDKFEPSASKMGEASESDFRIEDIMKIASERAKTGSQPSAAAYPIPSTPTAPGEAKASPTTPSEAKASPATPSESRHKPEHHSSNASSFKDFLSKFSGRTKSERDKLIHSILGCFDEGLVRFKLIPMTFKGSHKQWDNEKKYGSNVIRLRDIVGNTFKEPFVADADCKATVHKIYKQAALGDGGRNGLIIKIAIHGYRNDSDKDVALVCTSEHLNSYFTDALFIGLGKTSENFRNEPLVVYDITHSLKESSKHRQHLVSGRIDINKVKKEQIISGERDGKSVCVRVPPPFEKLIQQRKEERGYVSLTELRQEINRVDEDGTMANKWFLAYILENYTAKLNMTDACKPKKKGTFIKVPRNIVEEAYAEFSVKDRQHVELADVDISSLEFKIVPANAPTWSDDVGTEYAPIISTEGKISAMLTQHTGNLSQVEINKGRTVTFFVNITVIPSLTERDISLGEAQKPVESSQAKPDSMAEASNAQKGDNILNGLAKGVTGGVV